MAEEDTMDVAEEVNIIIIIIITIIINIIIIIIIIIIMIGRSRECRSRDEHNRCIEGSAKEGASIRRPSSWSS